jgi:hypothetical protein
MLPDESLLGKEELGQAVAPPGGPGWPESEIVVHLRRIANETSGFGGRFDTTYNLYESEETVVLLADPRARQGYTRQGSLAKSTGPADLTTEEGQCRRCEWPDYLSEDDDTVRELLVTGPYLRAFISPCRPSDVDPESPEISCTPGGAASSNAKRTITYLSDLGESYSLPFGFAKVVAWADAVPSPHQVSLAEPAQNAAVWSPGEAGAAVSLVSGEAMLAAADHVKPGRAMAFAVDRTYRSGTLGHGPLGSAGWGSSLFAHLREIPTTGEVEYHDGSGHVWRFYPNDSKGIAPSDTPTEDPEGLFYATRGAYDSQVDDDSDYYAPKGLYLRLQNSGDGWRMVGRHNDIATFNSQGCKFCGKSAGRCTSTRHGDIALLARVGHGKAYLPAAGM